MGRDPYPAAAGFDAYEVTRWEPRSKMDRAALRLARFVHDRWIRLVVVVLVVFLVGESYTVITSPSQVLLTGRQTVLLLVASVLPLFAIMLIVGITVERRREPLRNVVAIFVAAGAFGILAAIANNVSFTSAQPLSLFVVTGVAEESAKLLAVYVVAYRTLERPVDGLYMGLAAGAGFGAFENIEYAFNAAQTSGFSSGMGVAFDRFFDPLTGINAHLLFAGIAGLFLGIARFSPVERRGTIVTKGIVLAAAAHGLWDLVAFQSDALPDWVAVFFPAIEIAIASYLVWRVVQYHRVARLLRDTESATRLATDAVRSGTCPRCGGTLVRGGRFCPSCGRDNVVEIEWDPAHDPTHPLGAAALSSPPPPPE
jgi:RsiW-degrading membrane proteinase PrsW (M82 family)